MRHLLLPLALCAAAASAPTQNCLDGNFGTRIAAGVGDWLSGVIPIGFAFPIGSQSYTGMYVTDHGFVALNNNGVPAAPPLPSLYSPTLANFALGGPKVCAFYADIVAQNGEIYVDSQPSRCLITWRSMHNYGLPALRFDLQLALFPNGDARIVFGPGVTNDSTFGTPASNGITGISQGGGATLPPGSDLSIVGSTGNPALHELWTTPLSFDLANNTLILLAAGGGYSFAMLGAGINCAQAPRLGSSCGGLYHGAMGLPGLGTANYRLRIDNLPLVGTPGFFSFGNAVNPGIALGGIGMPGCSGYTDLAFGMYAGTATAFAISDVVLSIPASASLVGAQFASQGIALSTTTPLGLVASNGVLHTVGRGY